MVVMATNGAKSPLRRLREYYDRTNVVCPDCGYIDDDTGWVGETDGRHVHYYHSCPSCESVQERTIQLDR